MESRKAFGRLIVDARNNRGWQAKELAPKLGIGTSTLSNYENGYPKTPPDPDFLDLVNEVLGIPRTEMLLALGYLKPEDLGIAGPSAAEARLLPVIRSITWTPTMIDGAAVLLKGIREMARELRGIDVAPSELGEVNATEAMRDGPGDG